jgi:hypothetical protein
MLMRVFISFVVALALPLAVRAADSPTIKLVALKPGAPPVVEIAGLPKDTIARLAKLSAKEWGPIFRVVVAGGTDQELLARPPLAGAYMVTETGVRFEPQFPLVPGREYVALLQTDANATLIRVSLALPKPPPGPRVAITAVYPSANRLPENTLRFYIHFSGEVARGGIYRHLKLVRDDGVEVREPFLEVEEELWSADGRRVTILFHPGRVKRELVPRQELGAILEEGRTYTLEISDKWEDTEGRPLVAGFAKRFTAGPPDDQPVDPSLWTLVPPPPNWDEAPVIVRLAKPLDHAMLNRVVWVTDANGETVPGTLSVGGGERVVSFTPKTPWRRGDYKLVVDTRLEDVCGNRVGEPFEVDVFKPVTRTIPTKTFERSFTVR